MMRPQEWLVPKRSVFSSKTSEKGCSCNSCLEEKTLQQVLFELYRIAGVLQCLMQCQ